MRVFVTRLFELELFSQRIPARIAFALIFADDVIRLRPVLIVVYHVIGILPKNINTIKE